MQFRAPFRTERHSPCCWKCFQLVALVGNCPQLERMISLLVLPLQTPITGGCMSIQAFNHKAECFWGVLPNSIFHMGSADAFKTKLQPNFSSCSFILSSLPRVLIVHTSLHYRVCFPGIQPEKVSKLFFIFGHFLVSQTLDFKYFFFIHLKLF